MPPLLPVPCLMLSSPLSLSLSPAACGAAWAGKAGWWCYPWFWDSQSKMTLPISPTCNLLGRSRTSRTLRGTRGMSEDEGSPAGGGDEGLTQGGGGGGGGGWPREARRLERHRVAQRAAGTVTSAALPRRHPRFCLRSGGTKRTPIPSSSLLALSLLPSPATSPPPWLHAGGGHTLGSGAQGQGRALALGGEWGAEWWGGTTPGSQGAPGNAASAAEPPPHPNACLVHRAAGTSGPAWGGQLPWGRGDIPAVACAQPLLEPQG